jgi:hypothetical protein
MPRITVTTDATPQRAPSVLLEESVHSPHLRHDDHAEQLIQRLGWAITDAEDAQVGERAA